MTIKTKSLPFPRFQQSVIHLPETLERITEEGQLFTDDLKWRNKGNNSYLNFNPAVLKLGVATLFRAAKYFLRVTKVHHCLITLDSPWGQHQNRPRPTYSLHSRVAEI
jgi:hypothetical protein